MGDIPLWTWKGTQFETVPKSRLIPVDTSRWSCTDWKGWSDSSNNPSRQSWYLDQQGVGGKLPRRAYLLDRQQVHPAPHRNMGKLWTREEWPYGPMHSELNCWPREPVLLTISGINRRFVFTLFDRRILQFAPPRHTVVRRWVELIRGDPRQCSWLRFETCRISIVIVLFTTPLHVESWTSSGLSPVKSRSSTTAQVQIWRTCERNQSRPATFSGWLSRTSDSPRKT